MIELVIFDFNRTLFDPENNVEVSGCSRVLRYLKRKNIQIAIVSRKEKGNESRKELIEEQDFSKYVERIYYVESDSKCDTYKTILQDFDILKGNILVVGDYLEKDIKPAIDLGIKTVWFKNGIFSNLTPETTGIQPSFEISELAQVINIIEN